MSVLIRDCGLVSSLQKQKTRAPNNGTTSFFMRSGQIELRMPGFEMETYIKDWTLYEDAGGFYYPSALRISLALFNLNFGSSFKSLSVYPCVAGDPECLCPDERRYFKKLPRTEINKSEGSVFHYYLSPISIEESGERATLKLQNSARIDARKELKKLRAAHGQLKNVNWDEFDRAVDYALAKPFKSAGEIKKLEEMCLAQIDDDPWEFTDRENPRYHKKSLSILDDPLFWHTGSLISPHGSDIGILVLEDFFKFANGSRRRSTSRFLETTLVAHGITATPDKKERRKQDRLAFQRDPNIYLLTDEIVIAVVLADIKLKSKTTADLASLGVAACRRQYHPFVEEAIVRGLWKQRTENLKKVESIFRQFTNA